MLKREEKLQITKTNKGEKMSKRIRIENNGFVLSDGQAFTAHGINMVCKDRSRNYIGGYTPEDFIFLRENGFNLIRLGLIWDGAEPEPGKISEDYFNEIDRIIKMAEDAGIPVFLDMHQDLYGSVFEDGAPKWATVTDSCEHIRTGLWSESYLISPAVQHAFDNFWNNVPAPDGIGIIDHYRELWKYIAKRYARNPFVIGYDIMNEPFPGSDGAKIFEMITNITGEGGLADTPDEAKIGELIAAVSPVTARFETEVLVPFYSEIASAIRAVDKETIIMLESNYFANAAIPTALVPPKYSDGREISGLSYVPHGYDILVDTVDYGAGGFERVEFIFKTLFEGAERVGLPTIIGEWGCYPDADDAEKAQAVFLLGLFKEQGIGNVYFDFSHIKDGGILEILRSQK